MPAAVVLAAIALAAGCGDSGGDSERAGPLAWAEPPSRVPSPPETTDVVVQGELRNDSLRPVLLEAADVRIVAGDGEELTGQAIFLGGFARPLEPQNRGPAEETDFERRRLGKTAEIAPGGSAPVNVAWRAERPGEPARLVYPGGELPLPADRGADDR